MLADARAGHDLRGAGLLGAVRDRVLGALLSWWCFFALAGAVTAAVLEGGTPGKHHPLAAPSLFPEGGGRASTTAGGRG